MSLVWSSGRAVCQVKECEKYRPAFVQKWHMLVLCLVLAGTSVWTSMFQQSTKHNISVELVARPDVL